MTRLAIPGLADAPERSRPVLDFIESSMGWVPNFFRVCANSPQALSAHALLDTALTTMLDYGTRTHIALAVSQVNQSDYCIAGHSYHAAQVAGMSREEILSSRCGASRDERSNAAVFFACRVAEERGHVTDGDLNSVRAAGYGDGEIVEIVTVVIATCFTNFINAVAQTDVDYPTRSEIN